METLRTPLSDEDGVMKGDEEREKDREKDGRGTEASPAAVRTADEETDEDGEMERPPTVRRKVSFADAFGLDLVSVKEFDKVDVAESEIYRPDEREVTRAAEEFYIACLFTAPSSPEELDQKLQEQMVELESIELLPGTTTLRGIIRVVNLCYSKSVYARISLDHWNSYFDLLAEYLPGSSDRKTDRFTFLYTVVPPLEREGTRVEFCLRYETSAGAFWANNKDTNYVMFCHQRGHVKEHGPRGQEDDSRQKSKRGCLKANRRGSAEEKNREAISTAAASQEADSPHKAEEAVRKTVASAEIQSLLYHVEHKPLVDNMKRQQRATRLARAKDLFYQRSVDATGGSPLDDDGVDDNKGFQYAAARQGNPAGFFSKRRKRRTGESPQVLTYHQIPLITLDWKNDPLHQAAGVDDTWRQRRGSDKCRKDKPSVSDIWDAFLNGKDDTNDEEKSVCEVWRAFLDGPSCEDHSAVPESEWLQKAASVSPSNDKESHARHDAREGEHETALGTDAPSTSRAHSSRPRSDPHESSPLNTDNRTPEARVGVPRDLNAVSQGPSERSPANSETNTPRPSSSSALPAREGTVDSSAESRRHARLRGRCIIDRTEGIRGDEPSGPHAAGDVASSGETDAAEMTAMLESQNASTVDRISRGANREGVLSYNRGDEVIGTAENVTDDTLAFWETIRQGTKDGETFVFSAARHGAEKGITMSGMENKVSAEEMIFRPQKAEECEISQRYADENQCEEFRLNQNSENPLKNNKRDGNEIRPAPSRADEFNLSQIYEKNSRQDQIKGGEFIWDESEIKDVKSCNKYLEINQKEGEISCCPTSTKSETLTDTQAETIRDKKAGNGENPSLSKTEEDLALKSETDSYESVSDLTEDATRASRSGNAPEKSEATPETHPSAPLGTRNVLLHDWPFLADTCNPNLTEALEMRWTLSRGDRKGQNGGGELGPADVPTMKETYVKKDTPAKSTDRPEILERIGEDMSRIDEDEKTSIRILEIAANGERTANVKNPRREPAGKREDELSEEAESSPSVECEKLAARAKDAITTESAVALEVIDSGLDETFVERFGEKLARGIWEEAFGQRGGGGGGVQAAFAGVNIVDGVAHKLTDVSDGRYDCRFFSERASDDRFDPSESTVTQLPVNHNLSFYKIPESDERSARDRGQWQTSLFSQTQADLKSSARPGRDLNIASAAQRRRPSAEPGQIIQDGSVKQIEEGIVAHRQLVRSSDQQLSHPSGKTKESNGLIWWSILYILSHITRLLIGSVLVAGYFAVVFLCDFPAFFVLYVFSLCWWFYNWRSHREPAEKGAMD